MTEIDKYFPKLTQEQKEKYSKLVQLYKYWNSKVNLISRKDIDNLEINHILHSLSIVKIVSFKDSTSVLDVGTGGGLPGIPLAIFFPKVNFTLIDSIGKKIKVVKSICNELSINNVDAINDRVENHLDHYDFILSRAVTSMDKFYKLVNKNFRFNSSNKMKNGIISLKGGNLDEELKDFDEKNIYLYDKNHLINLNILNFVTNSKLKFKEFSENLNRILKSRIHHFPFDGKYLIENGMQQGSLIGKVLKEIEEEWIKNSFKISNERVREIIQLNSN